MCPTSSLKMSFHSGESVLRICFGGVVNNPENPVGLERLVTEGDSHIQVRHQPTKLRHLIRRNDPMCLRYGLR